MSIIQMSTISENLDQYYNKYNENSVDIEVDAKDSDCESYYSALEDNYQNAISFDNLFESNKRLSISWINLTLKLRKLCTRMRN